MDFQALQQRAVQIREQYAGLERRQYGRSWTKADIALGVVGDVGDVGGRSKGEAAAGSGKGGKGPRGKRGRGKGAQRAAGFDINLTREIGPQGLVLITSAGAGEVAQEAGPDDAGAAVTRAAMFYLMSQVEAGHCCPIYARCPSTARAAPGPPATCSQWRPG